MHVAATTDKLFESGTPNPYIITTYHLPCGLLLHYSTGYQHSPQNTYVAHMHTAVDSVKCASLHAGLLEGKALTSAVEQEGVQEG